MTSPRKTNVSYQTDAHLLSKRMARCQVIYTPAQLEHLPARRFEGAIAIVVDQLRATSTIITALAQGARRVVAVPTLEVAQAYRAAYPKVLLAGERGGLKPEGFDLGNSPLEFTPERVQGEEIVLTTTNGTGALLGCKRAQSVWVASLLNLGAVIDRLRSLPPEQPLLLVVAGTGANFSLEDGLVLAEILRVVQPAHPLVGLTAYRGSGYSQLLRRTQNGRRLCKLKLEADIDFCAQLNRFDLVPTCLFETLSGVWMAKIEGEEGTS